MKESKPCVRDSGLVVQESKNESLVYDLEANRAFCLNETSSLIWRLCDGTRSVEEIVAEISDQYSEPIRDELVLLALQQFAADDLLSDEQSESFTSHFDGVSRREVIRRIGYTSMIAIPVISSVVAPSSLMAQSCAPGTPGAPGAPGAPGQNGMDGAPCAGQQL